MLNKNHSQFSPHDVDCGDTFVTTTPNLEYGSENIFDVYLVEEGNYQNQEKLQPSGGWCYGSSDASYMTLVIMQGMQDVYYIDVEITQSGSGGVIVFPMGYEI